MGLDLFLFPMDISEGGTFDAELLDKTLRAWPDFREHTQGVGDNGKPWQMWHIDDEWGGCAVRLDDNRSIVIEGGTRQNITTLARVMADFPDECQYLNAGCGEPGFTNRDFDSFAEIQAAIEEDTGEAIAFRNEVMAGPWGPSDPKADRYNGDGTFRTEAFFLDENRTLVRSWLEEIFTGWEPVEEDSWRVSCDGVETVLQIGKSMLGYVRIEVTPPRWPGPEDFVREAHRRFGDDAKIQFHPVDGGRPVTLARFEGREDADTDAG